MVPIGEWALVQTDQQDLIDIFADNVGEALSVGDLIRVKVPSGGVPMWLIPDIEGDKYQDTIRGILVYWRDNKNMWRKELGDGGGGTPPDCRGVQVELPEGGKVWMGRGDRDGNGNMGPHDCSTCAFNQFGSAEKGDGKKCKDTRMFGVLTQDGILPMVLNAPATSIKPMKKFLIGLAGKRMPYWSAVVDLKLAKEKNDAGIDYCSISPVLVEPLTGTDKERLRTYKDMLKPMLDAVNENAAAEMRNAMNKRDDDSADADAADEATSFQDADLSDLQAMEDEADEE